MQSQYIPPRFEQREFHCPHCRVYSSQHWGKIYHACLGGVKSTEEYSASLCAHCNSIALWQDAKLIIPSLSAAPQPHEDLPQTIIEEYREASSIYSLSPRGAAALLRLALQKLMVELGEEGIDINKDIGSLVKKGLPVEVQRALDIVRVIGNESVHPGLYDMRDNQETVVQLFGLINFIVEEMISRKKRIGMLYATLPTNKLQGIENRDGVK